MNIDTIDFNIHLPFYDKDGEINYYSYQGEVFLHNNTTYFFASRQDGAGLFQMVMEGYLGRVSAPADFIVSTGEEISAGRAHLTSRMVNIDRNIMTMDEFSNCDDIDFNSKESIRFMFSKYVDSWDEYNVDF